VKKCEDFAPNFGDKRTGHCNTATHRLTLPFLPENYCQKQHDCRPPPTLLFLNTLTEHDFQDAFKKRKEKAEVLGTLHTHGRGLFLGDGGQ
jgi:hypothetical protein